MFKPENRESAIVICAALCLGFIVYHFYLIYENHQLRSLLAHPDTFPAEVRWYFDDEHFDVIHVQRGECVALSRSGETGYESKNCEGSAHGHSIYFGVNGR